MAKSEIEVEFSNKDQLLLEKYRHFIEQRRENGEPAHIFSADRKGAKDIAALITAGGLVAIPFGPKDRRIFILAASFDDPEALQKLNEAKGRPKNQTIAIGCLPESTDYFADLENNSILARAAEILGEKHGKFVLEYCYRYPVGFIIQAQAHVPEAVTAAKKDLRTVLMIGAIDYQDEDDIYNTVLWELSTGYGKAIAGTSANPSGMKVLSVYDQEEVYERFKYSIDGFVKGKILPERPFSRSHLISTTIIDLTEDYPIVRRWGSIHPKRFKNIFPDLVIPGDIAKEERRESDFDLLREKVGTNFRRLITSLRFS